MTLNPYKDFEVMLGSEDGKNSKIADYLVEISSTNPDLFKNAIIMLKKLPDLHFARTGNVKPFKNGKFKCFELRVKSGSNICRFMYEVVNPAFIIIHGFTKKTQKTEKRDIAKAENNYYLIKSKYNIKL
jgi:phage-related protein